jgi:membrane protein involved in colicin uptake
LSDIGNLVSNDPNSEAGQRYRISKLEQEVEELQQVSTSKNQEIYQQTENLINANLTIDEKDEEIEQLKSTIETLINQTTNE